MALTPLRWVGALLLLSAVGAGLALRESQRRVPMPHPRSALGDSVWTARIRAVRAADALRVLQISDSVSRTPGWTSRGVDGLVVDASLPPRIAADIRAMVTQAGRYRPDRPQHPLAIAVVAARGTTMQGIRRSPSIDTDYVLPANGSSPCVVVLQIDPGIRARLSRWNDYIEQKPGDLLGPCGYYEHFGSPGPHVAAWLERSSWTQALSSGWQSQPQPWSMPDWFERAGYRETDWLRSSFGLDGWRCLTGYAEVCLSVALADSTSGASSSWLPALFVPAYGVARQHGLGPLVRTYVASMVHDLGAERFQRFWSSDLPVPEAFARAAGEGLGPWTQRWTRRMYGEHGRGPGLATQGALLGAAIAGAALAVAFRVRRKRQVT